MNSVVELFIELASIPSPSLGEENLSNKIIEILNSWNIENYKDSYGNVVAKIKATDNNKKPILLSSHMDVVGDNSKVNITQRENIIETDKTRTLGADDKAGIASIMWFLKYVKENSSIIHGGVEVLFTRDEEKNMSGIKNAKYDDFKSKYVLVADSDMLGNIEYAGADYTNMLIEVKTLKGGHSGNDIADKTRINALNLISEVIYKLPSGAWKVEKTGTVTSLNLGVVAGGGIKQELNLEKQENYAKYLVENGINNVINTDAYAVYSIRSSSSGESEKLIKKIESTIEKINKKYKNLAKVILTYKKHLPMFEKSKDETMIKVCEKAGKNINLKTKTKTFHAGAETHIWANKKNKNGKTFAPLLIGCANVYNMHSKNEQVEATSIEQGVFWLIEIFKEFNK